MNNKTLVKNKSKNIINILRNNIYIIIYYYNKSNCNKEYFMFTKLIQY